MFHMRHFFFLFSSTRQDIHKPPVGMSNAVSDFVSPQGRIWGTVLEVGAKRQGIYVSVRWTASVRKKNEDPLAANRAMLEQ